MGKLSSENYVDLAKELEGIGQLFKWERIAKSVNAVNEKLAEKGFGPIVLDGPGDLAESFQLELEERWPPAFERFRTLVNRAAQAEEGSALQETVIPRRKGKKAKMKG